MSKYIKLKFPKRFTYIAFIVFFALNFRVLQSGAQSRKEFILKYRDIAIREMIRTGIPASISLAQGILESNCGVSYLAEHANNYFGIKCHEWEGPHVFMTDDAPNECFRKYKNPEQSWIDHSEFLVNRPRYAKLFELALSDYKGWAYGLKKAGYATNPQYAEILIKIIEEERLYEYDRPDKNNRIRNHLTYEIIALHYDLREEMRNGCLCIQANTDDSFEKIAMYYNIKLKKLLAYNDKHNQDIIEGQMIYLSKKKPKAARGYDYHRLKPGESLYLISQIYGVRLKNLIKYNGVTEQTRFRAGDKIYLRRKAK